MVYSPHCIDSILIPGVLSFLMQCIDDSWRQGVFEFADAVVRCICDMWTSISLRLAATHASLVPRFDRRIHYGQLISQHDIDITDHGTFRSQDTYTPSASGALLQYEPCELR